MIRENKRFSSEIKTPYLVSKLKEKKAYIKVCPPPKGFGKKKKPKQGGFFLRSVQTALIMESLPVGPFKSSRVKSLDASVQDEADRGSCFRLATFQIRCSLSSPKMSFPDFEIVLSFISLRGKEITSGLR
jgi:hypothetical protein